MSERPFHPIANEYPLMSEAQLKELIEAIRENGQRKPVVMLDGKVLDGRNRWLACEALGREQLTEAYLGPTDDKSLREFVADANERRMHHEAEFLANRRRERVAAARRGGKSIPVIAKEEGVSIGQVQRDLTKAANLIGGDKVEPEDGKAKGHDGRTRKATLPKREPKADAAADVGTPTPVEESNLIPPDKVEPETDKAGHTVPKAAQAAFANLDKFKALDSLAQQIQAGIDELARLPGGEELARFLQATQASGEKIIHKSKHLDSLKGDLKGTRPHSVCPYCCGTATANCKGCTGRGWVTKITWDGADESVKARIAP